ncbi:hypothetical protein [Roseinatronobacter bogoriensis]|uniref:hypothetical protein n=1 Tax=Roseinatronobacter bogoriensis TaxID=119542 RepID=UPI001FD3F252|nr:MULTISPECIES: hypothetical protein [Rhodobaca]
MARSDQPPVKQPFEIGHRQVQMKRNHTGGHQSAARHCNNQIKITWQVRQHANNIGFKIGVAFEFHENLSG